MSVSLCVSSSPPARSPGIRLNCSNQLGGSSRQGLEGVCRVDGNIPAAFPTRAKAPASRCGEEGPGSSLPGRARGGLHPHPSLWFWPSRIQPRAGEPAFFTTGGGGKSLCLLALPGRGTPGGIWGICHPRFLAVGMPLGLVGTCYFDGFILLHFSPFHVTWIAHFFLVWCWHTFLGIEPHLNTIS